MISCECFYNGSIQNFGGAEVFYFQSEVETYQFSEMSASFFSGWLFGWRCCFTHYWEQRVGGSTGGERAGEAFPSVWGCGRWPFISFPNKSTGEMSEVLWRQRRRELILPGMFKRDFTEGRRGFDPERGPQVCQMDKRKYTPGQEVRRYLVCVLNNEAGCDLSVGWAAGQWGAGDVAGAVGKPRKAMDTELGLVL